MPEPTKQPQPKAPRRRLLRRFLICSLIGHDSTPVHCKPGDCHLGAGARYRCRRCREEWTLTPYPFPTF